MELTIEQALQQGVAAHREGKLEKAERLYRAILKLQPAHPDANHNLGVIAFSVNRAGLSLPLFRTALEANPSIEQFWLSYIDALIKKNQFNDAKRVLEQAKNQGVAEEKLNVLEIRLTLSLQVNEPKLDVQNKTLSLPQKRKKLSKQKKKKNKATKQNSNVNNPPQQQLGSLLEYYQQGRFNDAEKLAVLITNEFPKHQFSWKVLGAVLNQLGRIPESVVPKEKAVELAPNDADAHHNLGITLQKLGRLDEAENSYRQAITLKPEYAEAYSNLGNTLKEQGRLEEAEASYRRAIALNPNYAEAYSNLSNTLKEQGRLEEAENSYRQAITLKPEYAEAHSNLGNTLKEQGRLKEAEASYTKAITLKPNFAEAHYNLGITLQELGRLDEAEKSYGRAIALKVEYPEAYSNLGNTLQELGRLDEAEVNYKQALALKPENFKTRQKLLMCLFQQEKKFSFFEELDYLINTDKASAIIGSLTCRSALKYGLEKPNLFCTKPLNYVLHSDLNSRYNFEEIFVKKARSILFENRTLNRSQSLLVNGNQTLGNIFDIKNDDTIEIQQLIRSEVEKYRVKFKKSEEGLIKKMPTEYSLYGWLISMKSGGNIMPHIHSEGWLSGSIYINVPQKLKVDSGNLVVSLGEENDVIDKRMNEKKTINVVTGSIVLFPSSLTHYTIPFESEEERIVLAFDVKEK